MQVVRLLSIDGGGVRGKVAAEFLRCLEHDLSDPIYNHFDLFAGTSTGALIILNLVANQQSAGQTAELYSPELLQRIFAKSKWNWLPFNWGAKYHGEGKKQVMAEIFTSKRLLKIEKPTLVTAYDLSLHKAVIFKSNGGSDSLYNPLVAEVAEITSAAPTYFPSILTSEAIPRNLIDGGVAANNPGLCLISEALSEGYQLKQIRLLSIGCGYKPEQAIKIQKPKNWGSIKWLTNGLVDDFILGNSSLTQYQCRKLLAENYLEINGPLNNIKLDDISAENLSLLAAVGRSWYASWRLKVLSFLRN